MNGATEALITEILDKILIFQHLFDFIVFNVYTENGFQ